jgi:hypothetical protein
MQAETLTMPNCGSAAETACHFCGENSSGKKRVSLYPGNSALKAEIHSLYTSGQKHTADGARIYALPERKGYFQSVSIPCCDVCSKRHGTPLKVMLIAFLTSLPGTIALSAVGMWPSFLTAARGLATERVHLGDYSVRMSLPYVLMMAGVFYVLPSIVVAFVACSIAGWQCDRIAAAMGVKKESDVADAPAVKVQLVLGWSLKAPG